MGKTWKEGAKSGRRALIVRITEGRASKRGGVDAFLFPDDEIVQSRSRHLR